MEDNMIEGGIGMADDLINRACSESMKAHKLSGKHYLRSKIRGSPDVVFAFAGSWSVNEVFKHKSFGEEDIDLEMFRSMRSIGPNKTAQVNAAFAERYKILHKTLKIEVEKDRKKGKQIVFAGHSSGGPIAIFATLWFLENANQTEGDQIPFRCLTFGSPLTGDKIFGHAIKRENWSRNFTHFVMKHDIVPRILLAPVTHIEGELQKVLNIFKNYKPAIHPNDLLQAQVLFREVMKNASSVASYDASTLMGCPNMLLETLSTYIELSPYKPFGKYIFCSGNGKLVVVENSNAVLQMLFYSSQLDSEAQDVEIALKSLHEHMSYEKGLQESLTIKNLICLNHLQNLPLSSVGDTLNKDSTEMALSDLGLNARARLCLRAAGEFEDQKKKNESSIDKYEVTIAEGLKEIEAYQIECEGCNMNYYDTFKLQDNTIDFKANIKRIELSGIWDEIIDLVQNYELPDEFESRQNWIMLGTQFRQLVEPLDIANYYRHSKNESGTYMKKGRPRRYKFTQRWSEHASKTEFRSISSSSFWAEVEELPNKKFEVIKEKLEVETLEKALQKWQGEGKLGKHVFSDGSTVANLWKKLPEQHKSISCLAQYISH
ncbi:protein EDS1B-like [Apium graveolens]|uniref:protein EDS1B-like n=1 Tax=Apium graveolens TaxID=4045 RepID=UPI003D799DE6